jgi:hypothetical protein
MNSCGCDCCLVPIVLLPAMMGVRRNLQYSVLIEGWGELCVIDLYRHSSRSCFSMKRTMTLMTVAAAAAAAAAVYVVAVQSHDTIPKNDYCCYCSGHGYHQSCRSNPFSVKEEVQQKLHRMSMHSE